MMEYTYITMIKRDQTQKYMFNHPETWDEMNQSRFEREPKFLAQIFQKYGNVKDVLDVGCGSGSHLARLGKFGMTGMGVDLNPKMIAFARSKYPKLSFELKDMRSLTFRNRFDAVICLCTTFTYNTTNEDVVSALRGFHRALRRGGLLVIDLFNPISFIEKREFKEKMELSYSEVGLRSELEHQIDERAQLLIAKQTTIRLEENKKIDVNKTAYRLFFPQEMKYFLETTGFELLDFYGSFDLGDKQLGGPRMIVVAKK